MRTRLENKSATAPNTGLLDVRCSLALKVLALFLCAAPIVHAADDLSWPPITPQTKPTAFWWWMGSAVDKANLAKELQRYHDAGMGGVHIIPIYEARGWESNHIDYLSPKWMDMLDFTVTQARKLDMNIDMTLGTGWCFGGPTVSDEDANANVVVTNFTLQAGQKLTEKFNRGSTQALVAFSPDAKPVDLTAKISAGGTVDWSAPAGSWKIYAVSQKPSGQKVKRAAPGGEGWMLNPIYPKAVSDWMTWFEDAFKNYHGAKPRATFQDSYEYRSDWSPDFFAQFEKRRGYKLQDELPTFFGKGDDNHTARVKYDYRRTVSEVMAEESAPAWIGWSHKHGFITRYQAHGSPANWLDLYADADIPETEMFHNDRSIFISKFASSAAHVAGHQLTSAETGTWVTEHFTETLGDLKTIADDMFLAGVNHIVYHGVCYSPDEAGWPGWHFYASTEMNPRNSIWRDAPQLNGYIARVQSVLQSGKPDNDILLYWPVADFWSNPSGMLQSMTVSQTGWFADQPISKTAHELWNQGYSFDYISDAQLEKTKTTRSGDIQIRAGVFHDIVVIPKCRFIPLKTFQRLLALAKGGVKVIFEDNMPDDIPGLANLENDRATFKKLKAQLSRAPNLEDKSGAYRAYSVGNGVFYEARGFEGVKMVLEDWHFFRESMIDSSIYFIRRSFAGGWNYFVVNRSTNNFDGWISLSENANSVMLLDPMTGETGVAATRQISSSRAVVAEPDIDQFRLQLAAGQSMILRAFADKKIQGVAWNYVETKGSPVEITGDWNVKFISGGPTLPAEAQMTKLASWTTLSDTNTAAFGGAANYEITFDAPRRGEFHEPQNDASKNSGTRETRPSDYYLLNLGDVRQSARVKLNGKDYGTLITAPFQVLVDNLQATGNKLEIEVTSVDANRIRDLDRRGVKWKIFRDINFVNVNYRPFDASDWPLTDCGLLGPVTLTSVKSN